MDKSKIRSYILLHIIIFVYSMSSILSKKAALAEFLSMRFIIFYGLVLVCMGVYAIVWQQVIKNLPLNAAFANKSVTVIWGMIWGSLFFHETITPKMALGALIVIAGVIMVITGGEKEEKENTQQ
ncbi:MAG: EamA family transporter [Oscillospiraceae bacterium]|nr:EamA family transporter [Oscillospiraceae bacterium]